LQRCQFTDQLGLVSLQAVAAVVQEHNARVSSLLRTLACAVHYSIYLIPRAGCTICPKALPGIVSEDDAGSRVQRFSTVTWYDVAPDQTAVYVAVVQSALRLPAAAVVHHMLLLMLLALLSTPPLQPNISIVGQAPCGQYKQACAVQCTHTACNKIMHITVLQHC
jgi:hypothetical protein